MGKQHGDPFLQWPLFLAYLLTSKVGKHEKTEELRLK